MLVKCLDADEEKYPPTTGSALARTALASVWVSETQSSMDEFVAASKSASTGGEGAWKPTKTS